MEAFIIVQKWVWSVVQKAGFHYVTTLGWSAGTRLGGWREGGRREFAQDRSEKFVYLSDVHVSVCALGSSYTARTAAEPCMVTTEVF